MIVLSAASFFASATLAHGGAPIRADGSARPVAVHSYDARVLAVSPRNRGRHIRSLLVLRTDEGRLLRMLIPSGRQGHFELRATAWPVLRRGTRIRAQVVRSGEGLRLVSATSLDATRAWSKLGCCTLPAARLPVPFVTDANVPQDAAVSIRAGIGWWTADPASYVDAAWLGTGTHGAFDDCTSRAGSYVALGPVRAIYGPNTVGYAQYCIDELGITEIHVMLDPTIDYPLTALAAHEWGHGLGLDHSSDPAAVMYPIVPVASGLGADDVTGLRALYPGVYGLDIRPVDVPRLTAGVPRDLDVPVRVVGGATCQGAAKSVRIVDPSPLLEVSGAAIQNGEVSLGPDDTDPTLCHARLTLGLRTPVTGSLILRLAPGGSPVASGESRDLVVPLNLAPAASFITSPASPIAGAPTTLISTSSDGDGDQLSESWDLDGDGLFDDATGPQASVTFAAGEHAVALQVSDGWTTRTAQSSLLVETATTVTLPPPTTTPGPGPRETTVRPVGPSTTLRPVSSTTQHASCAARRSRVAALRSRAARLKRAERRATGARQRTLRRQRTRAQRDQRTAQRRLDSCVQTGGS